MRDWIVGVVRSLGAGGVGALMFLENVFPPIPSELVMPLAGYLSARGQMDFTLAVTLGTAGALAGAVGWYVVGRRMGREGTRRWIRRRGRWIAVSIDDVERAQEWFDRHGGLTVLFGRLVPGLRTVVSLPAGFSEMPWPSFLLYSLVGTAVWTAALAWAGRLLGRQFQALEQWIGVVSWVVLGGVLAWYLWRVARGAGEESEEGRGWGGSPG